MADQIVITEKTSQAKDVRAAVGSRYGDILPAEGHLFDLLEPEDVVPAWKRWSAILLRPEGLYGTRPAEGGNKAAKLRAIRDALRTAKRVWLATDCDREGQLIGQEILEHYEYRGQVMRVLFTAQDSQTIRDAFARAKPNAEYASLYAPTAGVVLVKNAEPGEFIVPGGAVITLGDIERPWLKAFINESDLGRVKLGQRVSVTTDSYPGKVYQGKIIFISSEAEFTPKNVQTAKERVKLVYRIKVSLANLEFELKPGMPADARIHLKDES